MAGSIQGVLGLAGTPALRGRLVALLAAVAILLAACAAGPPSSGQSVPRTSGVPIADESVWLDRLTFGVDTGSVAEYRRLGREAYIEQQLAPDVHPLPEAVAAALAGLEVAHLDPAGELLRVRAERKRINDLPDGADKETPRKALNDRGNRLAAEAGRRIVLEALYSRQQVREQMVWFWLNHFSVFQQKADLRWTIADYEAHAIRPHALGHFRDLVLATVVHPAMLQYLDNAQNAAGRINENYARELMELHTLGVGSGYSQGDVQELARVLTGLGLWDGRETPHLRREWQGLYRHEGAMEFNPARHDFGPKSLLGGQIRSRGFAEVEEAVERLVRSPACAQFIARKLATYWVADQPPEALVGRLAATFRQSDGDIAAVLRTLFRSPEFRASLGHKFRDPYHFVLGAVRFAYDGRVVTNTRSISNWLNALGEPLFGHLTPDGYPMGENGWASSGQLSRRFEIAKALGSGGAGLFESEGGGGAAAAAFPRLSTRLYFEDVEPRLSPSTRAVLEQTTSQQEWNTMLLASPEFNYR